MGAPRIARLDKNLIINGNFDYAQRGSSFNHISTHPYTLDRFQGGSNWLNTTIERVEDAPNANSRYSMKQTNNNSGTKIGTLPSLSTYR